MKLKLDENPPNDLATYLSERGHDVDTVLDERLGGEDDPAVVAASSRAGRVLFTLDRGVGDIRRYPPGSHPGIVVLRPESQDPERIVQLVDRFLLEHDPESLRSCVVAAEPGRVRVRRPQADGS